MAAGIWGGGCRAIGTKAVDTSSLKNRGGIWLLSTPGAIEAHTRSWYGRVPGDVFDTWQLSALVEYTKSRSSNLICIWYGRALDVFWVLGLTRVQNHVRVGSGRTKKITNSLNSVKWHASIFTHQRKHSNGLWWCLWFVLAEAEGTKNSARSHYNQLEAKSVWWRRDAAEAEGTKHSARSHFSRWEEKILWWTRMFRGHKRQASTRWEKEEWGISVSAWEAKILL